MTNGRTEFLQSYENIWQPETRCHSTSLESTAEVHAMSLANLDGEYAQILSAEQALREL